MFYKRFNITINGDINQSIVLPRIVSMIEVQIRGKVPGNLRYVTVSHNSKLGPGYSYNFVFDHPSGTGSGTGYKRPTEAEKENERMVIQYFTFGGRDDHKDYLLLRYWDDDDRNIGEIIVNNIRIVVNKRTIIKLNCKDIYRNRIKAN